MEEFEALPTPKENEVEDDAEIGSDKLKNGHGKAIRSLIASLHNEPQMRSLKTDQAATLKELQELKTGLQALNKQSDSEYAAIAPEFLKAARLAALVKADLNEISKRLHSIQNKMNQLDRSRQSTRSMPGSSGP